MYSIYVDGGFMPIADRAPYLGTNMTAKGNPHLEISIRIINTTTTLNKLDMFWKKAPVSTTWKLRVHDAVISSKLLYGLESASLTNAEYERLESFQIRALRKMLGIKHSYHSHVSNVVVMQRANQRIRLKEGKTITYEDVREMYKQTIKSSCHTSWEQKKTILRKLVL